MCASQRAPLASRNRQTNAATAGIASMIERMGKPCIAPRSARDRPGDRGGKPDQHDERVGVDIAALQPPGDAAATGAHRPQPVGAEPVDRALLPTPPPPPTTPEKRTN